ncbi:hypothetical protein [Streptomyces sp. NPDC007094]|uniref:hypothetical protein n=1 Tax=Streptomyces sp. NPDC007094 TaxID=3155359 RepID=UPI0033F8363A
MVFRPGTGWTCFEGSLVAGFAKVYPTPEVEEFTLTPARGEGEAAAKKLQERSRSRPSRTDTAASLLIREGVRFGRETADPDQRLRQDELRHLLDG